MKKQVRHDIRLALRKETVRALNQLDLDGVAGGEPTTTVIPTRILCPTVRICLTTGTATTANQ